MNGEQMEKIKNIIELSGSFALLLNLHPEEHELLAAEALKAALEEKGKSVYLFPKTSEEFKKRWVDIIPIEKKNTPFYINFIRIPKDKCGIKEITYENDEDFFAFKIISERSGLNKENVIFESLPQTATVDVAFIIGPSLEGASKDMEKRVSLPAKDKIISLNPDGKAIEGIIQDIIQDMGEDILSRQNISTLLFASLLFEKTRQYEQSSEETAKREEGLISSGANEEVAEKGIIEMLSLDNLPIS